jgi:hypothetical protein
MPGAALLVRPLVVWVRVRPTGRNPSNSSLVTYVVGNV